MWHVSASILRKRPHQHAERLHQPRRLEREAVDALRGVGGDREWWYYSPRRVGNLRVAMTAEEAEQLPPWEGPIDDAGESGPERPRTR